MNAAYFAAIIDPAREHKDWWYQEPMSLRPEWLYCGPEDLHTARCYTWLGEEYLEEHDWLWARKHNGSQFENFTECRKIGKRAQVLLEIRYLDHCTAIWTAVSQEHSNLNLRALRASVVNQ